MCTYVYKPKDTDCTVFLHISSPIIYYTVRSFKNSVSVFWVIQFPAVTNAFFFYMHTVYKLTTLFWILHIQVKIQCLNSFHLSLVFFIRKISKFNNGSESAKYSTVSLAYIYEDIPSFTQKKTLVTSLFPRFVPILNICNTHEQ